MLTLQILSSPIAAASSSSAIIAGAGANISRLRINGATSNPLVNQTFLNLATGSVGQVVIANALHTSGGGEFWKPGGMDHTDPDVIVAGGNITNSDVLLEGNQTTTTTTITIPAQDANVISNVGGWAVSLSERMTLNSNGSAVYNGKENKTLGLVRSLKIDPANTTFELGIREWCVSPTQNTVTFTNGTNVINETSTPRTNGDTITFRATAGTLPAEIDDDKIYYVVNKTTDSFQISYTEDGTAIAFTDDGSGTNSYKVVVLHGETPSQDITAGSPAVLSLHAKVPATENMETVATVINKSGSQDIRVYSGGYISV